MKHLKLWSTLFIATFASTLTVAGAVADDKKKQTRSERRLESVMEKYQATGNTESCVNLRFLKESTIIDNQTIFFESIGKKGYMNRLPHRCSQLMSQERFAYKTSLNQLCSTDIITVLDSFGREWGSCGLGKFEEMERKPKDEKSTEEGEK